MKLANVRQTMTDKQIIIDGVDVAKCRCFTSEWDFNNCGHICKGTECKYKRLWYKKQLKAKEQECDRLKKELETIYDDCKGCPTCNEALYNANLYAKEYRKLKQTLAEIKEIAEKSYRTPLAEKDCIKCDEFLEQILQKVRESEINNDNK